MPLGVATVILLLHAGLGIAQEVTGLIPLPELNSPAADSSPDISGDGRLIVFQSSRADGSGAEDIYLYDRTVGAFVTLPALNSAGPDFSPTVSADGRYLAFASIRPGGAGAADVYLYDLPGRAFVPLPNLNTSAEESFPVLGADGRFIAYRASRAAEPSDILLYDRNARTVVSLPGVATPDHEENGQLSDDARFIAFFRVRGREFLGDFLFDRQTRLLQRHTLRITDLGADGRLVVILEVTGGQSDVGLYDREAGRAIPLPGLNSPTFDNAGRLSPAGRSLAFASFRNGLMNPDIFLYRRP